jgi:hypothetical protein
VRLFCSATKLEIADTSSEPDGLSCSRKWILFSAFLCNEVFYTAPSTIHSIVSDVSASRSSRYLLRLSKRKQDPPFHGVLRLPTTLTGVSSPGSKTMMLSVEIYYRCQNVCRAFIFQPLHFNFASSAQLLWNPINCFP